MTTNFCCCCCKFRTTRVESKRLHWTQRLWETSPYPVFILGWGIMEKRDKGEKEEEHNHISSPGHSNSRSRPGWRVIHLAAAGRLNTPLYWMTQRFRMVGEWPLSSCLLAKSTALAWNFQFFWTAWKRIEKCKENNVKGMKSIKRHLKAENSEYKTESIEL